ncbi:MAG: DUF11 domain-containing protein, partial [Methanobrevibacter sp.]|nr:DUF11 domain-containing protein [Methanobrevibacter sp.]
IDLESADAEDIVDDSQSKDSALNALNDEESEDILGAQGDMSDLAPMYEADKDYSENHVYDIEPSDSTREFLSHFREVSPGYTYANPAGKHPIDIFWTAIENNTIYFIFYMDEDDYKELHPRLTIDGVKYGDAGESTDGRDHIIFISDTQDEFYGVTVVKFIDIPTTTTTGTLYVNRNHGDPIKDLSIKVLNQTNTTLYVNDKFEDTIYLGQDANLSAFVTLLNFEDVKVTEGTVHYYLRSINGTPLETPLEVGTSLPGDNPNFVPVTYLPDAIGDYIFSAWYEDYEEAHNFESHSNNVTLHVIEPPKTDLSVEKSVDNDAPDYGTDVTYTITVTNNGPNDATGVQVTDKLPDGLVYVSDDSDGKYDSATGVWDLGDLANEASATLKIIATVTSLNSINNTAKITNLNEEDTDPENDEDSVIVKANPIIDLAVVKEVDNDAPDYGSDVAYTITVTNNGPNDATGVQITDKLPDGLVYVSDDSDGKYDSATGVWDIGALNNQSTVTLTITATVKSISEINNTAKVTDSNEKDNVTDNDEDSVIVTSVPIIDLEILKEVDNDAPDFGSDVTYTITVTNNGP